MSSPLTQYFGILFGRKYIVWSESDFFPVVIGYLGYFTRFSVTYERLLIFQNVIVLNYIFQQKCCFFMGLKYSAIFFPSSSLY